MNLGQLFDKKGGQYSVENLTEIQKKTLQQEKEATSDDKTYKITAFARPRAGTTAGASASRTVRYPSQIDIESDTDYVSIDFYNYKPPFGQGEDQSSKASGDQGMGQIYENYNHSIGDGLLESPAIGYKSILLFMPEDVQAQYGANWVVLVSV